ncbi:MAG: bifunctional DNA-formamidopyrimidine glycosylase/DNA-(apurinic or apyrimidinic site) lyase [Caldilineaceae bacterium]|nr:bifunctional DNA-formamidopyrimidine glycosylase/DNA-(apurinic or apyrimidinic site) lyase [Caldilineaceae bacterium]
MPELPEVETYIRELRPQLAGKRVVAGEVKWPRIIATPEPALFTELIRDRRFDTFGRRGKYMLLGLDSGETLIVHLRMTGEVRIHPASVLPDKHTHLLLTLDSNERLHYRDPRKFGRLWLVDDPESVVGKLGPEPLDEGFTPEGFASRLAGRTASIKALLLNQSIVAGVGNIYADEALFLARIDPRRSGGELSMPQVSVLHAAVRAVLQAGIEGRGSSLQSYAPPSGEKGSFQENHKVFRRTDLPCYQCGAAIRRIVLAQRSTHFCPQCQS